MGRRWPLIGRIDELRFIAAAARSGDGPRGVVIAGGAGVGKTRLAREAVQALGFSGQQVQWITGTVTARSIPMGAPMAQVGNSPFAEVDHPSAPAIAVVDDAHLLDHVTASMVHQLALRDAAIVVAIVRSGEPAPDAITALWKDGLLDRLELQTLSEPATADLLQAVLDGPVDTISVRRFWELARGIALFLRLLVEGERAANRLRRQGGSVWIWAGSPVLTPSVSELVADRMGAQPGAVRDVLDLIALAEPLPASLLRDLSSVDGIEEAERLGLIRAEQRSDGDVQIRSAHPLYSEAQRAAMGSVRAKRLRGILAAALSTNCGEGEQVRIAVLLLESDPAPDPKVLTAAAQQSLARQDPLLAQPLARAAVAAGGGFDAQLVLAYSQTLMPGPVNPDHAFRQLADSGDDAQHARVARLRAGNLLFTLQRPGEALDVLADAVGRIDDDGERAGVRATGAVFLAFLGQPATAVQVGRTGLAGQDLDDHAAMMAAWGLVAGLGHLGRAEEIWEAADRATIAAGRSPEAAALAMPVANGLTYTLAIAGRIGDAQNAARGSAPRRGKSGRVDVEHRHRESGHRRVVFRSRTPGDHVAAAGPGAVRGRPERLAVHGVAVARPGAGTCW